MSGVPEFIDNLDGNTMVSALRQFLGKGTTSGSDDIVVGISEARIATAYFSPEGFAKIVPLIKEIPTIRLMLGSDPIADGQHWRRKLNEPEQKFVSRKIEENLKKQEEFIRAERDFFPFTRETNSVLKHLVEALKNGNIQVKRFKENFLHAKAYIFTPTESDEASDSHRKEGIIAGSSNLTAAGLASNHELNLGRYDSATVEKATIWFDRLWDQAEPFDLAAFFEEAFVPRSPFDIFLRVLWELYGEEMMKEADNDGKLPLTNFQKHGVARAWRLINETGGAIVADEVGLGKTLIAGEIVSKYQGNRQRCLLICPAALRDTTWANFKDQFTLYLEVVSFEQLAGDRRLFHEQRRPNANHDTLLNELHDYQLIIIDEAHNYRNPDSNHRADALRALLYGMRKDVLMLTATPVNNSLWDLYHLTRFFVKQDAFLAKKGIPSIKARFDQAMKVNPHSLSPDELFPIIDATTVKRTRKFIQKHYPRETIIGPDGSEQQIVFPEPQAITLRYDLDDLMPGLFDLVEKYFDPENNDCIAFARYNTKQYLLKPDPDEDLGGWATTGLILSGLLKRFESSTEAFRISLERLIKQHEQFLKGLDQGHVLTTAYLKESVNLDDEAFAELLETSDETFDAELFDQVPLRDDVTKDLQKLVEIHSIVKEITPDRDPKLSELLKAILVIPAEAKDETAVRDDQINKSKILIYSYFADTVHWIRTYLEQAVEQNPELAIYKDRIDSITSSGAKEDDSSKARAAARFSPETAATARVPDETNLLISTDVLAEGVNLQQARHIINYDMPWNPMRLVQRHGRIDRIGSKHRRVFLRTIFPADRLDALLGLEERISRKIAMAAASVGVQSPVTTAIGSDRDFTETREEIEKLMREDATLFKMGGTEASTQSGEEYRQTLRKAFQTRSQAILGMPWRSGSGMAKGKDQGILFCARVDDQPYLRFVHADEKWQVRLMELDLGGTVPMIDEEIGRCLRVIECEEEQEPVINQNIHEAAYDLWRAAQENIHKDWMFRSDPKNMQPRVRPLNRKVADFINSNPPNPKSIGQEKIEEALDILESPWPMRDERQLRIWFQGELNGGEKSEYLIEKILASGLEKYEMPERLPPINLDDIKLIVWMAISAETKK